MAAKRLIEGTVLLAQETRFQLVDDAGVAHLFVLAHGASAEPADLAMLQRQRARVRVHASEAADLKARAAHRIELCPATGAR